ncbi:MAG: enoyl-CoA hydratase/isomerase family protein, partial [Aquincola sp.]|nr:enoyl-CoA hydratase/isomerase family protein [Aquincola sp.]
MTASYEVRGQVAVITLNNPPVNGLGYETRKATAEGIARANNDAAIKAIVLTGAGKAFSGGADIREFGSPKALAEPNLLSLIKVVENSGKPVVAAIDSVCMGGGLELALGCHYRVVAPGTQVALPEVKLGLVPGAGGTQRLPRVLGVEVALNMIVKGDPVKSEQLAALPGQKLFDQLAEGDVLEAALAYAQQVADVRPLPLVRHLKARHPEGDAYFQFARNTVKAMAKNFPAPARCVDCVEQATKARNIDDGLAYERDAFISLMMTPECKALRHAFFAERAASKIPDVPEDTPQRKIEKVAVIGAGTMGGGISMNFLNAGIPVTILETKQEALDRGIATIRKN